MTKPLITAVFVAFSWSSLFAQAQNLDSLLEVSKRVKGADLIHTYYEIGVHHNEFGNAESKQQIEDIASRILKLSNEVHYDLGLAQGNYLLHSYHQEAGRLEKSEEFLIQAWEVVSSLDETVWRIKVLRGFGILEHSRSNFDKSLSYHFRVLDLVEEDDPILSAAYNSIGVNYEKKGDFPRALNYHLKALAINEKEGNLEGIQLSTQTISIIYLRLKQYEKALEYCDRSLAIDIQSDYVKVAGIANKGAIYDEMGDYPNALIQYQEGLPIVKRLGIYLWEAFYLYNLGYVYYQLDQLDSAEAYLERSLSVEVDRAGTALEYIYFDIQSGIKQKRGDLEEAEVLAKQWLAVGKAQGVLDTQSFAYLRIFEIQKELGKYQEALENYEQHVAIEDSIRNDEELKAAAILESEYEFSKERDSIQYANQVVLMQKNTEIRVGNVRNTFTAIVGVLIIIGGVLIARNRIKLKTQETKRLQEISQFKQAMTGMIAHDLKNPLGVILAKEQVPSLKNMAGQMLGLVNNMLDVQKFQEAEVQLRQAAVDLRDILSTACDQVAFLADQKHITLQVALGKEMDVWIDEALMTRVFVNFLTNAIRFSELNSKVNIHAELNAEDQVTIQIQDFGKGINEEDQQLIFEAYGQADPQNAGVTISTGLGLTFCKKVLAAHGTTIDLVSSPGKGSTFSFRLKVSRVHESATVEQVPNPLEMTSSEIASIKAILPRLKELEIHHAVKIENLLKPFKEEPSDRLRKWAQSVLYAAYKGNQKYYQELIAVFS